MRSVVIVYAPGAKAMSRRLRQEVEGLGFEVRLRPESDAESSLEAVAVPADAVAAIRVKPLGSVDEEPDVELSIVDHVTGKTVRRELARGTGADPESEELVATRTVELLRASLMEVEASQPSRRTVEPADSERALVRHDDASRMRKDYGVLLLASGPSLSLMPKFEPSASLWFEASWVSRIGIGASLELLVPISAARLSEAEGSVDARATSYRLGGAWDGVSSASRFSSRLSAGWSVTTLGLTSRAESGYLGLRADRVAWGPWLSVAGRARLFDHLHAIARADISYASPEQRIRFADRDVGSYEKPAVGLGAGLEFAWP